LKTGSLSGGFPARTVEVKGSRKRDAQLPLQERDHRRGEVVASGIGEELVRGDAGRDDPHGEVADDLAARGDLDRSAE
jgi:hypothetical protein